MSHTGQEKACVVYYLIVIYCPVCRFHEIQNGGHRHIGQSRVYRQTAVTLESFQILTCHFMISSASSDPGANLPHA